MTLIQATMQMTVTSKVVPKLVLLWEEVGLCIHKGAYTARNEKTTYSVSHFNSGKSILRYIRSLEEAKHYMQRIRDEVLEDWTFTLQDWESEVNSELRSETKKLVDAINREILEI